jgi:glycosyltransferase involved in cell wall biosynthesis
MSDTARLTTTEGSHPRSEAELATGKERSAMTALKRRPSNPPTAAYPRKREQIRAVAVVIPAHNEQELLDACLDVMEAAAWRVRDRGIPVLLFVVADACTDATRALARRRGLTCVTVHANNVGAARAAGVTAALSRLAESGFDPAHIYLLHTDADTLVEPDWITRHLDEAADHDAVLGPVTVQDWSPRTEECAQRFALHDQREPDDHCVHGANLGVRADAYARVGGFPALPVAEDHSLVDALRTAREDVVFRRDLTVCTSARVSKRLRGGFSDYLSSLEEHGNAHVEHLEDEQQPTEAQRSAARVNLAAATEKLPCSE